MKKAETILHITTANDHIYIPYHCDQEEALNDFIALLNEMGNMIVFEVSETKETIMVVKEQIQTIRIYPKPTPKKKELN